MFNIGDKDVKVVSRDGKETGHTTGSTRRCQMDGCLGRRLGVRWPDGKVTFPCTKGMVAREQSWKIM